MSVTLSELLNLSDIRVLICKMEIITVATQQCAGTDCYNLIKFKILPLLKIKLCILKH